MSSLREILIRLLDAVSKPAPLVYCRLIETRGSTPQKAGAAMIVFADGSQAGTLGGGCVEAEVKRRALAVLDGGATEVCSFQLDSDYGWDDGLICGGRMQILVEPLRGNTIPTYFQRLSGLLQQGKGLTEAIVFDSAASQLEAPASYLFDDAGELVTVRPHAQQAGAAPALVGQHLRPLSSRPRAYAAQGVAYLPTLPRCRLLIVGGGHVGKAVADLAADLDFDVWVVDDRQDYVSAERFGKASRRMHGPVGRILPEIEINPDTYCIIVTRGHSHDEEALFHLAQRPARYVGMIGSRRKIKMIFDDLQNEGISAEDLARVHAPLGIDIGSQTVPEIAVSICAELVAHRNRGGAVPSRPRPVLQSRSQPSSR